MHAESTVPDATARISGAVVLAVTFQIRDDGFDIRRVRVAGKGHLGAFDYGLRITNERAQRGFIPDQMGSIQFLGVCAAQV